MGALIPEEEFVQLCERAAGIDAFQLVELIKHTAAAQNFPPGWVDCS